MRREEIQVGNIVFGLETMVIGFAVVMITLFCLYLILVGFNRCLAKPVKCEFKTTNMTESDATPLEDAVGAPVAATATAHTTPTAAMVAATVAATIAAAGPAQRPARTSPAIVAAITASVTNCLDTSAVKFYISPAQRESTVNLTTTWSLLGRKRLIEMRQDIFLYRRERRK